MTQRIRISLTCAAMSLGLALPLVSHAQLVSASAAALASGGNYTALARNFNAVNWNPANLGLPGNSPFSMAILPVQAYAATGPVTPKMLKDFEGKLIDDNTKKQWLADITSKGGQSMNGDAGLTYLAGNFGRIGFQLSTGVFAGGKISPATAEILLFGNAGYTGNAKDYTLAGSTVDVSVLTTAAVSYAHSLSLKLGPLPNQTFSVGVTGKYILGNALATGIESGGSFTANPVTVRENFPIIRTDTSANNGSGVGLDVGAAWQAGGLRVGAAVKNIVNTFAWDKSKFVYSPVIATFTKDSSTASADAQPIANAPAALLARLDELKIKPQLAAGAAFSPIGILTISADLRQQLGDGLTLGAKTQTGVGAELRLIPFLPIRAGLSHVTGGTRLGAGVGLELKVINLQLGISHATLDGAEEGGVGLTLSFGGH